MNHKINRLLARHLRAGARARVLFKQSGEALDQALDHGAPVGEAIDVVLRRGKNPEQRRVVIHDQFAGKNTAFGTKAFQRFTVADWKEPKPARSQPSTEAAS